MIKIKKIIGRQIIDSRGNPTCEADVFLDNGIIGRGAVPSGASTGKLEAIELRDNDPTSYLGKSVLNAVLNINFEIASGLIKIVLILKNLLTNFLLILMERITSQDLVLMQFLHVALHLPKLKH